MITLLISIALGILLARFANRWLRTKPNTDESVFTTGMCVALMFMLALLVATQIGASLVPIERKMTATHTLAAVKSTGSAYGTFITSAGPNKEGAHLLFFSRDKNGVLTPHTVRADEKVHISESAQLKQYGIHKTTEDRYVESSIWTWFAVGKDNLNQVVSEDFILPQGAAEAQFATR